MLKQENFLVSFTRPKFPGLFLKPKRIDVTNSSIKVMSFHDRSSYDSSNLKSEFVSFCKTFSFLKQMRWQEKWFFVCAKFQFTEQIFYCRFSKNMYKSTVGMCKHCSNDKCQEIFFYLRGFYLHLMLKCFRILVFDRRCTRNKHDAKESIFSKVLWNFYSLNDILMWFPKNIKNRLLLPP